MTRRQWQWNVCLYALCLLLFAGSRASPTRFFMWEQPGGWGWEKIGHTHLSPFEAATFNYLVYLGSSFIKSILISSYLVELTNSSLGPYTERRSYKHLESATFTTHSSTASAFKMNENQNNVAWFQDFRNERRKRPAGLVLQPLYICGTWLPVSLA